MQHLGHAGSLKNPLYISVLFRRRFAPSDRRQDQVLSDTTLRELDERLLRDIGISRWLVEWRNE